MATMASHSGIEKMRLYTVKHMSYVVFLCKCPLPAAMRTDFAQKSAKACALTSLLSLLAASMRVFRAQTL